MEPQVPARVERRLAAILVMDVGGYSRLIEADEEGTVAAPKALRCELDDSEVNTFAGLSGAQRVAPSG